MTRAASAFLLVAAIGSAPTQAPSRLEAVLVRPAGVTPESLAVWRRDGCNAVVLVLDEVTLAAVGGAARRIEGAGLGLHYWIEVGRNPRMADAHPEWMASLQGHPEWRRYYPDLRQPGPVEVVKNYPWVPISYRESFEAHLERVGSLLRDLPAALGIFLNDLQGAPSACGCGNLLCRWTSDYGPKLTATRLGADAAARFVAAVRKLAPAVEIHPVWVTECEERDRGDACAGVGCFEGACWRELTAQLMALAEEAPRLAALVPYRAFGRDLDRYGARAGWVRHALASFADMPPRRGGRAVAPERWIAVLQGWGVTREEVSAQIARAREAGAGGFVVAQSEIEQGWEPRLVPLR